jgi:hypothetical protein
MSPSYGYRSIGEADMGYLPCKRLLVSWRSSVALLPPHSRLRLAPALGGETGSFSLRFWKIARLTVIFICLPLRIAVGCTVSSDIGGIGVGDRLRGLFLPSENKCHAPA